MAKRSSARSVIWYAVGMLSWSVGAKCPDRFGGRSPLQLDTPGASGILEGITPSSLTRKD